MQVKVIRKFKDKHTKLIHKVNKVLEVSEERYEEIQSKGKYVVPVDEISISKDETPEGTGEVPEERAEDEAPEEGAEEHVEGEAPEEGAEEYTEGEAPEEGAEEHAEGEAPEEGAEEYTEGKAPEEQEKEPAAVELEEMSIQDLRKMAKEKGVSAAGSKEEIVARIRA